MANTNSKKKTKKKYKAWQVILYSLLLLFFIGVILVCVIGTAFFIYIATTAPLFDEEKMYKSVPSTMYDANGNVIMNIGTEDRVLLTYDEIPEVLVNAIIATEDSKFFQHNGIDLPRFLVASVKQVLGGTGGGASTITMQISKNNYTNKNDKGWAGIQRKFWDIYIAVFKIEPAYSKQEILEFYVNSFYMGGGYGVETTAKAYFGKSAKDLNLSEAAMIAGLYQAPGAYNPYTDPEATEERRQDVLYLMHRHGYISDEEYNIAEKMTVSKIIQERTTTDIGSGLVNSDYQYFVDMVIQDVIAKTGASPYTTSMKIYTTLDPKAQKHISDIMNGKTYKWENKKVQAGIAVVNTETGAITAIGGGRNVKTAQTFNRATALNKQIGSTAKPLYDYGPAIEYLNWNTTTLVNDSKTTYSDGTEINNWDGRYIGFNTIEHHLVDSRNIPALKTFKAVDKKDIIKFVTGLGLTPEIYSCNDGYKLVKNKCISKTDSNVVVDAKQSTKIHEAHAIGGYNGESPLSMAAAYAAFGNGGYYNEPFSFTKIIYNDTDETYVNKTETRQVMQDSTAYMITMMLQKAAKSYSYANINNSKHAAKTGTTNFDSKTIKQKHLKSNAVNDLWIVGYDTEYSIGIWYGYDTIDEGTNRFGSSQNQRLLQAVGKGIFKSKNDFKKPDSIVEVTVEKNNAEPLLPSKNTPSSYKTKAYFISGLEPNKVSTRFNKLTDVSDLTTTDNGDGTATVSWTPVSTPDPLNLDYLVKLYKNALTDSVNSYAKSILNKNKSLFGQFGYNVYIENSSGKLELLGFTTASSYSFSRYNGSHNIVVKTSYSKYPSLASDGKSVTANITGSLLVDPSDIIDDDTDDNQNNEDLNNNTNNNNGINGNRVNNNQFNFNRSNSNRNRRLLNPLYNN